VKFVIISICVEKYFLQDLLTVWST